MSDNHTDANKLKLSINLKIVSILLLAIIAVMLIVWKPWNQSISQDARTITVTGTSTVKAEPDEFVFYPTYDFKNSDKAVALDELSKKSTEIISGLKAVGVADKDIKTNASDNNYYYYYDTSTKLNSYTLRITVNVAKKELSQKVQDYLTSTTPSGQVTPQANFSDAKRKQLESTARDEATKEARSKADQSAKNLGFKVGKVKSVEDGSGFGQIYPMSSGAAMDSASTSVSAAPSIGVQPGENELEYSVTVVYYLR